MDTRAGLDDLENRKFLTLLGFELRPLRRPARSQSLYRLRYPGSSTEQGAEENVWTEERDEVTGGGVNCIMSSFITCTVHQILEWPDRGG
jgi:hypothetical protein